MAQNAKSMGGAGCMHRAGGKKSGPGGRKQTSVLNAMHSEHPIWDLGSTRQDFSISVWLIEKALNMPQ
jgi:hypothetical protein